MAAIRKTTDKKVEYVVISHPSGDHATGGWYFREDRPLIIGSRKQMRDLYSRSASNSSSGAAPGRAFAVYKGAELVAPTSASMARSRCSSAG